MIDQQFASAKDTEEQAYELKGKYEDALKSEMCIRDRVRGKGNGTYCT